MGLVAGHGQSFADHHVLDEEAQHQVLLHYPDDCRVHCRPGCAFRGRTRLLLQHIPQRHGQL